MRKNIPNISNTILELDKRVLIYSEKDNLIYILNPFNIKIKEGKVDSWKDMFAKVEQL